MILAGDAHVYERVPGLPRGSLSGGTRFGAERRSPFYLSRVAAAYIPTITGSGTRDDFLYCAPVTEEKAGKISRTGWDFWMVGMRLLPVLHGLEGMGSGVWRAVVNQECCFWFSRMRVILRFVLWLEVGVNNVDVGGIMMSFRKSYSVGEFTTLVLVLVRCIWGNEKTD